MPDETLLKKGSRTALIAVVVGAVLLGVFRRLYPETSPVEVLKVVGVAALVLAALVDYLWRRRRKEEERK